MSVGVKVISLTLSTIALLLILTLLNSCSSSIELINKHCRNNDIEKVLEYANSRDNRNKREVLKCLSTKREASYVGNIIEIAKGSDPATVRYAIEVLGKYNSREVSNYLLGLIKDPNSSLSVKINALAAFSKYVDNENKRYLSSMLLSENDALRIASAKSLAMAGYNDGEKEALSLLTSSNIIVQRAAVESIGYFKSKDHVPLLVQYTDDPDPYVRSNAQSSLKMILGDNYSNYLIQNTFAYEPVNKDNTTFETSFKSSPVNVESTKAEKVEKSDVDKNIPVTYKTASNTYALVIGNEDYSSFQKNLDEESNVVFARNDALTFKEYLIDIFGVPSENIIVLIDAGTIEMHRSIEKLKLLAKNSNGNCNLIFYYAGHGYPDPITQEGYIIPVDVTTNDLSFAINLKTLYAELTEYPTKKVTAFIDACFSGGGRVNGLTSTRGVKIKPKKELLSGNIVVFNSSSEDQQSLPYYEKSHGFFTYYLLKKLKETKGDISYEELDNFLNNNVSIRSIIINNKEQIPKTNVSLTIEEQWRGWKLFED